MLFIAAKTAILASAQTTGQRAEIGRLMMLAQWHIPRYAGNAADLTQTNRYDILLRMPNSWMSDDERWRNDAQEREEEMRKKYVEMVDIMRVVVNFLNRCECGANKKALDFIRSKQHLWRA